jgi:hypothetical protein
MEAQHVTLPSFQESPMQYVLVLCVGGQCTAVPVRDAQRKHYLVTAMAHRKENTLLADKNYRLSYYEPSQKFLFSMF